MTSTARRRVEKTGSEQATGNTPTTTGDVRKAMAIYCSRLLTLPWGIISQYSGTANINNVNTRIYPQYMLEELWSVCAWFPGDDKAVTLNARRPSHCCCCCCCCPRSPTNHNLPTTVNFPLWSPPLHPPTRSCRLSEADETESLDSYSSQDVWRSKPSPGTTPNEDAISATILLLVFVTAESRAQHCC